MKLLFFVDKTWEGIWIYINGIDIGINLVMESVKLELIFVSTKPELVFESIELWLTHTGISARVALNFVSKLIN